MGLPVTLLLLMGLLPPPPLGQAVVSMGGEYMIQGWALLVMPMVSAWVTIYD